jgi:hypothetical protein
MIAAAGLWVPIPAMTLPARLFDPAGAADKVITVELWRK